MNKYFKNYILSTANTFVALLFPIVTFPYISRILGASNIGIINTAQSYGYYFIHIANFGINSYAIREVSKVRDNAEQTGTVCGEIFNLNFFFSLIGFILYYLGVVMNQSYKEHFWAFFIYSFVILTNFLTLDWLLQSFDDYFFSTIRNIAVRLLSLAAVFVFVKKPEHYIIYLIISCVSEMGTRISTLLYSRKTYVNLKLSIKLLRFSSHIKTMFTLFVYRLVNGITANLDKLMIGQLMAYKDVGVYTCGITIITMLQSIVETAGIVLFPKINRSAFTSKKDYENNLKINYDLILIVAIPMTVGIFLTSRRIIQLFGGNEFLEAVNVSRIMCFGIIAGAVGDLLGSKILLVNNREQSLLNTSMISAASNIILNYILINKYGIEGAALASIASYLITDCFRYYYARKIVKIRLLSKNLLKYLILSIPFVLIYLPYKERIDGNTVDMFVFVIVCITIYVIELLISQDYLLKNIIKIIIKKEK
ncbi:flippase [Pseudobutyrivibrio sp. LB2011]|uniref:flippase n=1 Tax=Pseudobutyrivibrio sp. LB2011 TaxID=1408312 RepID=UPI0005D19863|nr:flippase [Pseudobutyrivibrio sp. LB2011]